MTVKQLADAKWIKLYDVDGHIVASRRAAAELAFFNRSKCDAVKLAAGGIVR